MGIAWLKSPYPKFGEGINNARSAVAFALLSIPVWAGCAYFAWIRWQSGADMGQFASGFEAGQMGGVPGQDPYGGQAGGYAAVPTATDAGAYAATTAGYEDQSAGGVNPFGATYQAPAY